ncbi:MAG: DNA translocase FtsK [Clostridia bacterium]|nr:DNA translocase FtsK [Clostridia bacterium]
MATKKRKSSSNTAARSHAQTTKKNGAANRQLTAVIWFAIALFLLFVVLIKGQNVWLAMHNVMFGIFGVLAYFYPLLMGAIAIACAMDKFAGAVKTKIIETGVLAVLVGAAIDIFVGGEAVSFWKYLTDAYASGTALKSGGFLGALIGHPICLAFGKTGAIITIIILLFVFVMVLTGTTLITLFRSVAKPVKKITEQVEAGYEERMAQNEEARKERERKAARYDVPLDDIPEVRKHAPDSLDEMGKKVVNTYYDEEEAEEGKTRRRTRKTAESGDVDSALADASEEAEKISSEEVREATREVTADINGGMKLTEDKGYKFPPVSLLKAASSGSAAEVSKEMDATAKNLVETLRSFGVETRIVDISRGPTVTRYELQPCAGVKISKITNLADDIALNLATAGVRIEAPIPNKAAVGIEVPNKASAVVGVREIIESPAFTASKSKLTVSMGRDIAGNVVVTDIAKMPHGLIAGATGSGKSVCINSIIMSILYKASPEEVKLLMIDPKVVELGIYNGIPHLLVPVVTDPRKAAGALGWAVSEMEKRYKMFADRGVRDLEGYNNLVATLTDEPEVEKMPHIVIIIDELADLMMTAPHEVEDSINRIAAKARAAGMHLLIATQRPSVDVVTGVIKANIPTRIAFAVSSQIDSRTILDFAGAEKLLGRGDMLFSPIGSTKPNRLQGCFVSDSEVEAVVKYIKGESTAEYDDNIMVEIERQAAIEKKQKTGLEEDGPDTDPMLEEAIRVVVENGMASTSLLQRKLKLGYARAARIVDEMENRGIVGPYDGPRPRQVLITMDQLLEQKAGEE